MSTDANSGEEGASRQLWLVPASSSAQSRLVADVAVDAPRAGLRSYAVPHALEAAIRPGAVVRVPYGRGGRLVQGFCVGLSSRPWDQTLRPVHAVEPGPPFVTESLLRLGLWVSDYYACAPWKTLAAMWPLVVRRPRTRAVRFVRATAEPAGQRLTAAQAALLATLAAGELPQAEALRRSGVSPATLRTLQRRGLLECSVRHEPVAPDDHTPPQPTFVPDPADAFVLTDGQRAATAAVIHALDCPEAFAVFLLFGVPGSGKTEVYVRAIRSVIERGRQAILLIPEIALATQIVERLARRFERVAVLHSQLSPRTRYDTLAAIASGAVSVVIGTRTAVFAPCPRLGLIVVDEEQETSFKNLASPYYHARDVAIKRGQLEGVPVVLGTATPSLETWFNAQQRPHFHLLRLPDRVPGARLPEVRLLTPAAPDLAPWAHGLSPELLSELNATLADGQQAILLQNRRGYALHLRCGTCGLPVSCPRCTTHLIYHRADHRMKCHRCGQRSDVPKRCLDSTCGGPLRRAGAGIQRLEEELRQAVPQARLLRLDSDTMRRRQDYEAALRRFEAGEADILLGTQMVAKGLDFPRVRLVGVIEADAALSLPDFRAGERVFQLIVQVVGRAGRREGASLALVQTGERPPTVIRHALRLDYVAFADEELELRRTYGYPPLVRLVRLVCADERPKRARHEVERLADALRARAAGIHADLRVDPPEPCALRQLRGMRRYQILLRGPRGPAIQELLQAAASEKLLWPRVRRFTIDVDPVDLL